MPYFQTQHTTRFTYPAAVRESVMELRVRPRDEWHQSCVQFELHVSPNTRVSAYRDCLGNHVHYFDMPGTHVRASMTATHIVRIDPLSAIPDAVDPGAWEELDALRNQPRVELWEMMHDSHFVRTTEKLAAFAEAIGAERRDDPLSTVRHISHALFEALDYRPNTTRVDSTIDEAIDAKAGVCQDYSHIMLSLLRRIGVPARYVSGYLYAPRPDASHPDAVVDPASEATHAWVEAMIPTVGWVGFDPTHDSAIDENYIRTAIGRDYGDVPPTRGVYRGSSQDEVSVDVKVERLESLPGQLARPYAVSGWVPPEQPQFVPDEPKPFEHFAQQMQQQQQ